MIKYCNHKPHRALRILIKLHLRSIEVSFEDYSFWYDLLHSLVFTSNAH